MKALLFLISLSFSFQLYSQGCSDAGFCTMGAMRPNQNYNKESSIKLRTIELNQYRGETTLTPIVWVTTLDVTVGINTRNFVQVKIPYQRISGNLTDFSNNKPVGGIGDISLSFTRNLIQKERYELHGTLGFKIPTNNSDIESEDGIDYHMYYQTSLGTFDMVAGAAIVTKNWLIATGYQLPFIHNNKNDFRWDEWGEYKGQAYILEHQKHPIGTELRRGSDVMLRVERNFRFSNYSFNVGLLPIYRITSDRAYNPTTKSSIKMDGTTGLALSALAGGTYHFNVNSSIKFMYGRKITQRDHNPDGLTRHAVYSLAYLYRF